MRQVAIAFKGGQITVSDEDEHEVEAERAVIFLVRGNDRPVASFTLADGTALELPVSELSFEKAMAPKTVERKRR